MVGFYNYTVIATYAGLCSAVCGIGFVLKGELFLGLVCLILAGLFDTFDGRIARTRNSTKDEHSFGIQLDSLTDLVAFGVLPAAIGFVLNDMANWFLPIMVGYVLTALIRLAYYNVTEYNRQQAALIFPLLWCFKGALAASFGYVYAAVMAVTAILFICPFKIGKPNLKVLFALAAVGAAILVFLLLQK